MLLALDILVGLAAAGSNRAVVVVAAAGDTWSWAALHNIVAVALSHTVHSDILGTDGSVAGLHSQAAAAAVAGRMSHAARIVVPPHKDGSTPAR